MATAAPPDGWKGWAVEEKKRLLLKLRESRLGTWRDTARADQLPPAEWETLLLMGGRGSGKTWAGAHILKEEIDADPALESEGPGVWAAVAPTFADARNKCIEGESGLLAAFHTNRSEVEKGISPTVKTWNRSIGEMVLLNGQKILIDGADNGAARIQGENLRGVWCDELGLWKLWEMAFDEAIAYALRKGQSRIIATGTPKRDRPARALIKRLMADEHVTTRRLLTRDNWAYLSEPFKRRVLRTANTSLGQQELEGIMLDEAEGALWRREWIDLGRVLQGPDVYRRRVLALDPSDGLDQSDEQAWCLAGIGEDRHIYVAQSEGMRTTPLDWLTKAVALAHSVNATIIVEKNHGGKFLTDLLDQAMKESGIRVPYKEVTASDGKRTRAEPSAMLYEQGANTKDPVVHHIGNLPELEDQMVNWTGEPGVASPDRMDAAVWALSELMDYSERPTVKTLVV